MAVMQPRKASKTWANDDAIAGAIKPGAPKVKAVIEKVPVKRPGGQVRVKKIAVFYLLYYSHCIYGTHTVFTPWTYIASGHVII
jgi:hypothetical protein